MHAAIKRANSDGTNVVTLFDKSVLGMPRGIALDTRENKIYWIDGSVRTRKGNSSLWLLSTEVMYLSPVTLP